MYLIMSKFAGMRWTVPFHGLAKADMVELANDTTFPAPKTWLDRSHMMVIH